MGQKNKGFEDLDSEQEIIEFLKKKGANHIGGYFHYTNIDALKGMLKHRKLHLSHGSEMNDLLEPKKGSIEEWKRLYVASFSVGNDESMAMWGIYGDPLAEALRIKFRCKSLRDCIKNCDLYEVKLNEDKFIYEPLNTDFTIELIDVAYLSHGKKHSTLYWNGEALRGTQKKYLNTLYNNTSFAGCLKNIAWKYERETRILVKLKSGLPNVKKIAIDISKAFDDIEMLCGPCLTKEHLEALLESSEGIAISESQNLGYIHFKNKCQECNHKRTTRCPRKRP